VRGERGEGGDVSGGHAEHVGGARVDVAKAEGGV
jgi:hypothetical protein